MNSDGSLKEWTSLSLSERLAVKDYFREPESDFRDAFEHQGLLHKVISEDVGSPRR